MHFIPLLIGAMIGSSVTYLIMDKNARKTISDSTEQVTSSVTNTLKAAKAKISGEPTTPVK